MKQIQLPGAIKSRTSSGCTKYHIYIHSPLQKIYRKSHTFNISNEVEYILPPKQTVNIRFPVIVETSAPATCILSCDPYLKALKIFHHINLIPTNDKYLNIDVYNNNEDPYKMPAYGLQVNCAIVFGNIFSIF